MWFGPELTRRVALNQLSRQVKEVLKNFKHNYLYIHTNLGFIPIIVDCVFDDGFKTNIEQIENKIKEIGAEHVCCIISTTSCFAPRKCDNIDSLAVLCKTYNIAHIVNNAYGLQSKYLMKRIQRAHRFKKNTENSADT